MKPIHWGILGAGRIAEKFAADFSAVTNGKIVAVGSRSFDNAKEFALKYNISNWFGSYQELVQNPDVDIIYIATPHNFHFEQVALCLEHGKHVLCEKPVTVNAIQLEQLIQLAKKQNLFFMEAMWTPFLPAVQKVMQWLKEGKIGTVKMIRVEFGYAGNSDPKNRLYNPELAGGALLDIGIYPLTMAEMVAQSKIETVQVQSVLSTTGIDETNVIQIKYQNGILAQLSSTFTAQLKNEAIIYGTKGMIVISSFWMSKKAQLTNDNGVETFIDESTTLGYNHEAQHVGEMLQLGKTESDVMPLSRSLLMMQLMDAIRKEMNLKYPFE
ncbi:MAG: Gfo/Idh/MocA family oxidoreductase [Salinivirgaceae bacterium]